MNLVFTRIRNTPIGLSDYVVNYNGYFNEPLIIQANYNALTPKQIDFHNRNEEDKRIGFNNSVVAIWRIKSIH